MSYGLLITRPKSRAGRLPVLLQHFILQHLSHLYLPLTRDVFRLGTIQSSRLKNILKTRATLRGKEITKGRKN